ncbi:hypothetical protein GBA52_006986 [Prunus armeniaca]|nr:hypothetical protein GBA52_006986 [Prunus armeniaca]
MTEIKNRKNKIIQTIIIGAPTEVRPSKNRRMPFKATRTRYSLVKGERIVRFVLDAWLRKLSNKQLLSFITPTLASSRSFSRCGTKVPTPQHFSKRPT